MKSTWQCYGISSDSSFYCYGYILLLLKQRGQKTGKLVASRPPSKLVQAGSVNSVRPTLVEGVALTDGARLAVKLARQTGYDTRLSQLGKLDGSIYDKRTLSTRR